MDILDDIVDSVKDGISSPLENPLGNLLDLAGPANGLGLLEKLGNADQGLVDKLFGAASILIDKDGDGSIEFTELASTAMLFL